MRRILQRQDDDCGIAALAMLLCVPYRSVRLVARLAAHDVTAGCTIDDFKRLSGLLRASLKVWYPGTQNRPKVIARLTGRPAILIVPAVGSPGEWHAVFWTGAVCHDPDPRRGYASDGIAALATFCTALVHDRQKDRQ